MKVRKEEEKFKKDIVEKCKEQPKLGYGFINGKIKVKETIERLRGEYGIVTDPKGMAELLNSRFQQVFTKESIFEIPQVNEERVYMEEIQVDKNEIYRLMGDLEDDKAMGPDEVSGSILKACRDELIGPINDWTNK